MKIKFNLDDSLPLNKALKLHNMTIIVRSVFEEDGKYYPEVFFRWMFVWVIKMLQCDRIDVSEGIGINKTSAAKECILCHYWYFKDGFKIELHVCDNCYDILMTAYNLKYLAVLNLRGLDHRCVLWGIKNKAVIRSNKSVLENKGVYKWILGQIRHLLK